MPDFESYKAQKRAISYIMAATNHPWYTPWLKGDSVIYELTCPNGHVAFKTEHGLVRCPICDYHGPPGPPVAIRVAAAATGNEKIVDNWYKRCKKI